MRIDDLSSWVLSCLLLGLRIAPVFALAPPFSLTRIPRLFLVLFGLGLSVCLVSAHPHGTQLADISLYGITVAAFREGALGIMFVLAFQIVFGALYLAGRTVDLQAGFGFATLIDPSSQSPLPLTGTLFAYAAGAAFFAMGGQYDLLKLLGSSLDVIPLGGWTMPSSISRLIGFTSMVFAVAMAIAAAIILVLFLIDATIALLSRTVPQMNVLVLGFQVKTLALFAVLPLSFALGSAAFLRLMNMTLEAIPRII